MKLEYILDIFSEIKLKHEFLCSWGFMLRKSPSFILFIWWEIMGWVDIKVACFNRQTDRQIDRKIPVEPLATEYKV